MSFFVSSAGSGNGGNLGGLDGGDKHCQTLAAKAARGTRTWRAYLSTSMPDANARDRIGSGPWYNAKGAQIASSVADLHSDKANINNDTALDEQGRPDQLGGRAQPPRHPDGVDGRGQGHHDDLPELDEQRRRAKRDAGAQDRLTFGKPGSPWNSAHPSKGCSQENLVATGGAGLIYCFAAK